MKWKLQSLPRRHGPSPLFVLASLLLVVATLSAAPTKAPISRKALTHPYLKTHYDGRRNLPLAAYSAGTFTEQDLFLFRLMKRDPDPALFQRWEESRRAKERENLAQDVEQALADLALTLLLADQRPERSASPIAEKYVRFLKYPVYQMVWIEKVLRSQVALEPIDLIKYYHDHVEEFYSPESVRVRYIFREVPTTATIAERNALEEEMKTVRGRVMAGEDFVELARAKSDAPSAVRGGELPPFPRGMFVEDFEKQAFALEPGQLSPVFLGRGGFYLIQCLEKLSEKQVPFDVAQKDLRDAVEWKTLGYLYDYHLTRMVRARRYTSLSTRFAELLPDEELLSIGGYRMTKKEFLQMFPDAVTEPVEMNEGLILRTCQDILQAEWVAQQIEQRGLAGDPLLVAADRLARRIWQSREAVRTARAVPLTFSESEVKDYYEKNRERLGYQPQWRVLRIEAAVHNPYLLHPSQLAAVGAELRTQFRQTLLDFQTAFREERAKAAEELVLAGESSPTLITAASVLEDEASTATARFRREMMPKIQGLRVFTEASTTDYQFTVTDLGYCNSHNERVFSYVKDLRESDLSDIMSLPQGGLMCYFVARYIPGAEVDYDKIRVHARRQYIASLQAETLDRLCKELTNKMALHVSLPEIGSKDQ